MIRFPILKDADNANMLPTTGMTPTGNPMIKLTMTGGYPEYLGLSYEAASREAARLLQKGIEGSWFFSLERLVQLREIMQRHICSVNPNEK